MYCILWLVVHKFVNYYEKAIFMGKLTAGKLSLGTLSAGELSSHTDAPLLVDITLVNYIHCLQLFKIGFSLQVFVADS